jgi:diguanylate cyclase (GGDEF)-like protein/PAS domain S-box-containing protein
MLVRFGINVATSMPTLSLRTGPNSSKNLSQPTVFDKYGFATGDLELLATVSAACCGEWIEWGGTQKVLQRRPIARSEVCLNVPFTKAPCSPSNPLILDIAALMEAIDQPDSGFPESATSLVSRCRILLVDPDRARREPLKRTLLREGFLVVEAESGQEAIRIVFAQDIDLVVLDLPSPPAAGLKLLAQLRAKHDQMTLPVVLVTGGEQPRHIVKAIQWGANDFVTRPVDSQVLLARVNTQVRLKRAQVALRESEERYAIAARGANDGLWDWNLISDDVYYSPRWLEMLGLTTTRVTACPDQWFSRVHAEDLARVKAELDAHCRGDSPHFETELRMLHEDGGFRWMLCRGLAVRDSEGKAVRIAGSLTDITEGKVADALTGLPNRLLFIDRLQRAIRRRRENPTHNFAVLYLDVDNFKLINDSLGHGFGDELLMAVANRVENCIRARETLVARLGGDEFAVLIEGIPSLDAVQLVADRVIYAISRPFIFQGREVYTTTSIGIAMGRRRALAGGRPVARSRHGDVSGQGTGP